MKTQIQVLKKNGNIQNFDDEKIKKAINKSATRVCIELSEEEQSKVVKIIKKRLQYNAVPIPVSTLHNMVECALDDVNPKVAKSYREYRDNKSSFASMLDKVYNKKLSLNFIGDRSNANADSALVTTQKAIVYNELNSELYKKFFLTREEEQAMSEGYIYIHDRGSRLDSINCCLFDMKSILTGGFQMGNLDYQEPKTIDVAFDLIGDVSMNAAACQYGGFSISEIDKLLAPYAKKSYDKYIKECKELLFETTLEDEDIEKKAEDYAWRKVTRDIEQGVQGLEMKFNSVATSRGDYPFTSISFGLGKSKFETLISFIISANNNIPRIKKSVELISRKYGKRLENDFYSFPTPIELSRATEEELKACGVGFRAKYIFNTCRKILDGFDLEKISKLTTNECKKELMKLMGVGPKVADCVMLFSMQKVDAFPIDVWIKRIMEELYIGKEASIKDIERFSKEKFGKYAGIAQQYLFFYVIGKSSKKASKTSNKKEFLLPQKTP